MGWPLQMSDPLGDDHTAAAIGGRPPSSLVQTRRPAVLCRLLASRAGGDDRWCTGRLSRGSTAGVGTLSATI